MRVWIHKLAAARLFALKKMPYMASTIYAMVPVPREGLGTLGITKDARLFYDPTFCESIDDEFLGTILIHESMHLLQKHFDRAVAKGVIGEDGKTGIVEQMIESIRWNIAADCEINDDLVAAKLPFPTTGPYVPCTPKKFNLEDGNLAEYYYDQLRDQDNKSSKGGKGKGGKVCGLSKKEQPQCGSGAGNPLPDEGAQKGEGKGRTQMEIENVRRETAQAIKAAEATQKGSVPAGMKRWADEILAPAKVDWRRRFSCRVRKCLGQRAGLIDFSYKRPSRRQAGHGNIIFPSMVQPIPTVGVIIDTSGSMSETDMGHGLGQVRHLLGATRADVYLAVCDAAVHNLKKVRTVYEIKASLVGGGGTDMSPALEALEKVGCDLIVGVSDCCAYWPDKPPHVPTIWLRCGGYKDNPPFGEVIDIDDGVAVDRSGE